MDTRFEQPEKAYEPMVVTLLGTSADFNSEQPEKQEDPIVSVLLGIFTLTRFLHPLKALSHISIMEFGK